MSVIRWDLIIPRSIMIRFSCRVNYKGRRAIIFSTHKRHPLATLQWRHDEHDGVSNRLRLDCLLNQIKENINGPRPWPLWGESTGWLPSQRPINAENDSINEVTMSGGHDDHINGYLVSMTKGFNYQHITKLSSHRIGNIIYVSSKQLHILKPLLLR